MHYEIEIVPVKGPPQERGLSHHTRGSTQLVPFLHQSNPLDTGPKVKKVERKQKGDLTGRSPPNVVDD